MASLKVEQAVAKQLAEYPFAHTFEARWSTSRSCPSYIAPRGLDELLAKGRLRHMVTSGEIVGVSNNCDSGGVPACRARCSHCFAYLELIQDPDTGQWFQSDSNTRHSTCTQFAGHRAYIEHLRALKVSPVELNQWHKQLADELRALIPEDFKVIGKQGDREYIYGLISERHADQIRYVGKTPNMLRRLEQHYGGSPKSPPYLHHWIRSEFEDGFLVRPLRLDIHSRPPRGRRQKAVRRVLQIEKEWIHRLVRDGHDLLNIMHRK